MKVAKLEKWRNGESKMRNEWKVRRKVREIEIEIEREKVIIHKYAVQIY
jgi:hypothetical protein